MNVTKTSSTSVNHEREAMANKRGEVHFDHKSDEDVFLETLDLMIESTEEFIGDDGLRADDSRIHDLSALLHVRELFTEVFQEENS